MEYNRKKNYQSIELNKNGSTIRSLPLYKKPLLKQYIAALAASIISMGTGCIGGWSSSAVPLLIEGQATDLGGIEKVTVDEASWITSLLNLGSLVGSIPAGHMSFYYGRKKFLLMLAVLLIIGWIFTIWNGNNVEYLYFGRFLSGFAAGGVCVAISIYTNEICCDVIRGRSGVFYDMMQVFGILYVYSASAVMSLFWSSIVCLLIPIIFLITFYWMPESPLHLIKNGKKAEAIETLRWLYGDDCDIEKELAKIYIALLEGKECEIDDKVPALSFSYFIFVSKFFNSLSKTTIKAFSIVLVLFIVQRSCGAPMIVYYTVDVFKSTHTNISPQTAAVYSGASQFFFSVMSITLIDRIGRKLLLIFSLTTMLLNMGIYVIYLVLISEGYEIKEQYGWIPIFSICITVGIFRLGVSPIPWFLCAELLPIDAQKWAIPTIFFIGWGLSFIWSKLFLEVITVLGYVPVFMFFMLICFIGILHTFVIPETKGKSRIEIQNALGADFSTYLEVKSNTVIVIEN